MKKLMIFVCCLIFSIPSFATHVLVSKNDQIVYSENSNQVVSIASITKLMSAMVILDSGLDLTKQYQISHEDVDTIKRSRSRLPVGVWLRGDTLLLVGLMSSDNRAISALMRNHPRGYHVGIAEMNQKARDIGMINTIFVEPTGLNPNNKSSLSDLLILLNHASDYQMIRDFTTTKTKMVRVRNRNLLYLNSNRLVRSGKWKNTTTSKTGFINEAGMCVVMQTRSGDDTFNIVVMDAYSNTNRFVIIDSLRKRNIIK